MKTLKPTLSFLLISSLIIFTNCTKDQNENYFNTTKEIISQGQWSVDYFYEGQDKTAQYTSYKFNFLGNGTVTATDGNTDFAGTWAMLVDVNRNDVLRINMATPDPNFIELNETWNVTEKTIDIVAMKEGDSQLRFKKL